MDMDDMDDTGNNLDFGPITTLSGTFTESDMSKFGYMVVVLPSGVTDPKMVKVEFNEELTRLNLMEQMPSFLTNSFLLHKHTLFWGWRYSFNRKRKGSCDQLKDYNLQ